MPKKPDLRQRGRDVALVLSMSGGALAANHYLLSSTKQISPKLLSKLEGATGKTGATGPAGSNGATGTAGAPGKEGPRGANSVIAIGGTENNSSCELSEESSNYCFPGAATTFTPTVNAKCVVNLGAQINETTSGNPTSNGPYLEDRDRRGRTGR